MVRVDVWGSIVNQYELDRQRFRDRAEAAKFHATARGISVTIAKAQDEFGPIPWIYYAVPFGIAAGWLVILVWAAISLAS